MLVLPEAPNPIVVAVAAPPLDHDGCFLLYSPRWAALLGLFAESAAFDGFVGTSGFSISPRRSDQALPLRHPLDLRSCSSPPVAVKL